MLVAFARYSRDGNFTVLHHNRGFLAIMSIGSTTGTVLGGLLLGAVPTNAVVPALVVILLASAAKVWRHQ